MKKLSVVIATLFCILLLLGPLGIINDMIYPKKSINKTSRMHLNTANTTRISSDSAEELSLKISKILYPDLEKDNAPQAIILLQSDKWQDFLCITPIINSYKSSVITVGDTVSDKVLDYIKSVNLKGISELNHTQLLVIAKNDRIKNQVSNMNLNLTYINYSDTNHLENIIYNMPGIISNHDYGFLVKDNDPLISIPVSTWITNQGGIVLYADKDNMLYNSSKELLKNKKFKKIYILADKNLDGDKILSPYKVRKDRIVASSPERFAIKFARFNDQKNNIGWGCDIQRKDVGHNYILCSKNTPMMAAVASQLAVKGRPGPILWSDSRRLSPITENYLWRMKPNYWFTSSEGPYNNIWVIGDEDIMDFSVQSRADYIEEINSYKTMGEQGVSRFEALSIIFILISICGAIWVTFHLFLRMRYLSLVTKIMWILTVLLLGPIGLWMYIISYVNSPRIKINNKVMWMRPLWKQTLVATAIGVSFGASCMIVIAFLMTKIGLPTISSFKDPKIFWIGNPIIIMMIFMYLISLILNIYIFVPAMFMETKNLSYKHAKRESVLVGFVSVTFLFIGMGLSIWFFNMVYVPQVPREDQIIWWGFMQLSTIIGGIISYIPNWQLVKYGKQIGTA